MKFIHLSTSLGSATKPAPRLQNPRWSGLVWSGLISFRKRSKVASFSGTVKLFGTWSPLSGVTPTWPLRELVNNKLVDRPFSIDITRNADVNRGPPFATFLHFQQPETDFKANFNFNLPPTPRACAAQSHLAAASCDYTPRHPPLRHFQANLAKTLRKYWKIANLNNELCLEFDEERSDVFEISNKIILRW